MISESVRYFLALALQSSLPSFTENIFMGGAAMKDISINLRISFYYDYMCGVSIAKEW